MTTFIPGKGDKACNLECVQDYLPIHEFVGPVKIVLMDMPKQVYSRKTCISAFIGLAHLLMGVTTFTVLFYTLAFKTPLFMNLHIVLCTIGYQLFVPSAILLINNLHGPAAVLKPQHRKFQHMFLNFCGIGCACAGSVLVMITTNYKLNVHSLAGLAAGGLSVLAAFTGPGAYFARNTALSRFGKWTHAFFGVPAFLASTVCFVIGLFTSKTFNDWAKFMPDLLYILIIFCVLYTFIILSTAMMRFCEKASKPV